jgi:hypothetical protein
MTPDDFGPLVAAGHWLGWLPGDPVSAVRVTLEELITDQVPGSVVEWVKVIDEPAFLTGGRRLPDDPGRIIATRAALALPVALGVRAPYSGPETLVGVFSWAASGLDGPGDRRDQVWIDLGMERTEAEQLLRERIRAVDEG